MLLFQCDSFCSEKFPARLIFVLLLLFAGCSVEPELKDTKTIPKNGIRISRYPQNTMCFKMTTADGIIVITDPYKMNERVNPDIVTISHEHHDHSNLSMLDGNYPLINKTGVFRYDGLLVVGVGGVHDKRHSYESMRLYTFDFGAIRIAHIAEQARIPTNEMYRSLGKVDVVILHFIDAKDPGNLSADEAALIVTELGAKIIITAHGDHKQDGILANKLDARYDICNTTSFVISPEILSSIKRRRVVRLFTDRL